MEMVVVVIVFIAVLGFMVWNHERDNRRRDFERESLVAEARGLVEQSYQTQQNLMNSFVESVEKITQGAATQAQNTAIHTVEAITKVMMAEYSGVVNQPVVQAGVLPEGDLNNPAWMDWEAADRNKSVEEFGIGDSVVVDRDFEDRVAMIENGQGIIPGVPLPDMSGEGYEE